MTSTEMGPLTRPGDPGYESARNTWNTLYAKTPAEIVTPADAAQVRAAVRYARERGLPLRIQSGGHSFDGYSTVQDGLLIRLAEMNSIEVHADSTVTVGPGVRLGDLYDRLAGAGLAVPGGTCGGVGAGGNSLGGGIGLLGRTHGWLAQSVRSLDLVNAGGDLLTVDDDHHPDLFWALRGAGGGNFGVVTSLTFQAYAIPEVTLGNLTWDWKHLADVADACQRAAPELSGDLNLIVDLRPGTVTLVVVSLSGPGETERALAPLLSRLPEPRTREVARTSYASAVTESIDPETLYSGRCRATTIMGSAAGPLGRDVLARIEGALSSARGETGVYFYVLGVPQVAAARHRGSAVALPHTDALVMLYSRIYWTDPGDDDFNLRWMRELAGATLSSLDATYLNSHDIHIDPRIEPRYGSGLPRLREVKRRYDPGSLFTFEGGIPLT